MKRKKMMSQVEEKHHELSSDAKVAYIDNFI